MINKINDDLKNAMKEKDSFKLSVLRMLKSALQLESISKKHDLDDSEAQAVIKKQVKLRKDSVVEYEKYGKTDEVASLNREIAILDAYLPEEMSEDVLVAIINEVINEVKPSSMKDMGIVMKQVTNQLAGKNADMSLASRIVKENLQKLN